MNKFSFLEKKNCEKFDEILEETNSEDDRRRLEFRLISLSWYSIADVIKFRKPVNLSTVIQVQFPIEKIK